MWRWLPMLAILSGALQAMTVAPPAFEDLVGDAAQILRVEATKIYSRWDEAAGKKTLHTYVECRVLRVLKGAAVENITLRFYGGRVGEAAMVVPDMPALAAGTRYIVFVRDNGRAFCPLVAVMYGNYPLATDAADGTERVLRSNGEPLNRLAQIGSGMKAGTPGRETAAAVHTAMSRDDFETSILNKVNHGAPK